MIPLAELSNASQFVLPRGFRFGAAKAGLKSKIHAEQLSRCASLPMALKAEAVSADHLDCVDDSDLALLSKAGTKWWWETWRTSMPA